ncbi:dehydrodolichyl diphosphate synthase domain protein, partial [Opisthorchis viverrini]
MLPTRIQRIASEMMLKTRHNTRLFLNICMAYGGQNELTDAAERIRLGVRDKVIHPSDVNPDLLSQCLYTGHSRPLDLFIRSSGEVRLSDFLVWQAAHSGVVHKFVESYWPNFTLWDLLGAILHYQLTLLQMSRLNPSSPYQATASSSGSTQRSGVGDKHRTLRIRRFLSQLDRSHWADLEKRSLSFQAPSNTEPRIIQRSVDRTTDETFCDIYGRQLRAADRFNHPDRTRHHHILQLDQQMNLNVPTQATDAVVYLYDLGSAALVVLWSEQ